MFKTTVTLTAASLINETGSDMSLPVCYALYQGGRLVAVSVKSVAVTGAGLSDTSTLIYPNYVRPDSCKVFILNADASPAGPPFVCLFS